MNKRSYGEAEPAEEDTDSLRSLHLTIWNLGERGTKLSLEQDLQNISSLLAQEHLHHGDSVFDSLHFCLSNLPYKASLYVAVLSLLSEREELGIRLKIKNWLDEDIKIALTDFSSSNGWWRLGHILRVWCELAANGLISSEGLLTFFHYLSDKGHSLLAGSDNQRLTSYWIGKSILTGFPFGALHLRQKNPDEYQALVKSLLDLFQMIKNNLKFTGITSNQEDDMYSLYFFDMVTPLEELLTNEFKFDLNILNPDNSPENLELPTITVDLTSYELPNDVSHFNLLRAPLRVHDDAHSGKVYDCWLVNLWLEQILEFFSNHHQKCIEALFAAIPEGYGGVPAKIIQNLLFGELLRSNQRYPVYYQAFIESLFIDGCRFSKAFPPALAKGVFSLVENDAFEKLNYRAVIRLATWFAIHLSSFDFKWPWDEWNKAAEAWPTSSLKRVFLQESFEQLLRLSYFERVSNVVPDYLKSLIPPQPKVNFSFANSSPESPELQFQSAVKTRQPIPELEEMLKHDSLPGDSQRRRVLFETVLNVGSKTFSHANNVTDRLLPLLKEYAGTIEGQIEAIQIASEFWKNNLLNFELALRRFLDMQIVTRDSILQFLQLSLRKAVEDSLSFDHIARRILRLQIIDIYNANSSQPIPINLEQLFSGLLVDSEVSERIHHFFATIY